MNEGVACHLIALAVQVGRGIIRKCARGVGRTVDKVDSPR